MSDTKRRFELLTPDRAVLIAGTIDSGGMAMRLADALLTQLPDHSFRYEYRLADGDSALGVSRRDGAWNYVARQTVIIPTAAAGRGATG